MEITFDQNKHCEAYQEFVENPESRASVKKFSRIFDAKITSAALKIHNKMKIADNAHVYNLTASHNNKIELLSGVPHKDPVVLKIKIQDSYRKFFYFCDNSSQDEPAFSLTKDWCGQFKNIFKIHVYEVNKHDYSKV